MPLDVHLKPVETLLFRSDIVAVGKFRCSAGDALFRDSGPCSHHTFVFPRTFTKIHQQGRAAFVAGPESVVLYNQHQLYTRTRISDVDASDWYTLADDVLLELTGTEQPDRPFRVSTVTAGARDFLAQRMIFDALDRGEPVDPQHVDETMLHVLSRVLQRREERPVRGQAEAVEHARELIARHPDENIPLRVLARACALSPFQLCRLFRARTGETITRYRHSLRLRLALDRLRSGVDLTTLALDLGYSSHSHFTAVFRRHFGTTPSEVRGQKAEGRSEAPDTSAF
ncbi:MAG TPA: AraC family transcriptional regulator [Thermoanaerobaculia bacterium]|nr:AraC family transcriptional regulator [Thermoanaerobaculia bacterium]